MVHLSYQFCAFWCHILNPKLQAQSKSLWSPSLQEMSICVQHILQNSLLHDLLPACNIHLHWRCLCAFLPIGDRLFWLKHHLAEELGVAGAAWHTVRCGLRAVCWKAGDYFWKPLFFFSSSCTTAHSSLCWQEAGYVLPPQIAAFREKSLPLQQRGA